MKHANISFFIPHIGCPLRCSFCDQRTISGEAKAPTAYEIKAELTAAYDRITDKSNTEIAFFGGSFTAIKREYMTALLDTAFEFVGDNGFAGIRISTRPDFIDEEILGILKSRGVTSIELGAQSMSDDVLVANRRGHTAQDVKNASALIKEHGFELGLQMMTGLYKSTPESDIKTAREIIALSPDTVRIYPVSVIEGTELAELYKSGVYKLIPFNDMISLCADLLLMFYKADIDVIRCGLHASQDVESRLVAGYYHPAFKDLCEGHIYRELIEKAIRQKPDSKLKIAVGERFLSTALGQKKTNIEYFKRLGCDVTLIPDKSVLKYEIKVLE